MLAAAGTPPDLFSPEGQWWGMPVFNWDALSKTNFKWWTERIKRNKEFFDLIRLDHFRAFAAYWEIPTGAGSAKYGAWKPGPGKSFFEQLKEQQGELSFVAEDLGDIDEEVIALREQFNLPGMKVLQFAFEDQMPFSDHIPHNYTQNFFVYSGTHDNNTTKGWYRQNMQGDQRKRLNQYIGKEISEENCANEFVRLGYASVAKTVIIPLQDILSLDERARMNVPSQVDGNWSWRVLPGQITEAIENNLREWVWLFNRQ